MKTQFKMRPAKWRPYCLGLDVLRHADAVRCENINATNQLGILRMMPYFVPGDLFLSVASFIKEVNPRLAKRHWFPMDI